MFLAFLLLSLSSASSFATLSSCPKLIDGQMLDFVNPGGIRLTKSRGGNCDRLLSCDVIGAPVELTEVRWYVNGRKIHLSVDGTAPEETDVNTKKNEPTGRGAIGVGEVSHRLCADNWLVGAQLLSVLGAETEFRCEAALDCAEQYIESDPLLIVGMPGRRRRTTTGAEGRLLTPFESVSPAGGRSSQPPLISMVTSSRMELTGIPLRIACAATGMPKPRVSWDVVGVDGIELDRPRPAEEFPFITGRENGQLLIDSSSAVLRDVASISMRCTANNRDGEDSAKSLVILLSDARK